MSALTDLFSAMANKIRSKTGTQTTYTPAEMVADGIDDVFDAGAASVPSPSSITPSNASPVALTANAPVNPTASGYAIESYSSAQLTYDSDYDFAIGTIFKNAGSYPGKIIRSRGTITPSAEGTAFNNSGWYKMTTGGYAYSAKPSSGASGTVTDTVGNAQTVTINTGLSSISKFALRCEGNSQGNYHADVFWTSSDSSNYEGGTFSGAGSVSGIYNVKALDTAVHIYCPTLVSISGGTVTLKTGANAASAIKNGWWVACS